METMVEGQIQLSGIDGKKTYKMRQVTRSEKPVYGLMKRGFDIVLGIVAFLVALLPSLLIALVIVLDSPGGAIFKQERLGRGGKPFMLYKFRTMVADAERDGAQWAKKNDERCTRVGRILRALRFDELPQILNILRGEMSFVGPRPERACFYEEFETYIEGFSQRLFVTPGLTGLAQVNGGYDLKPEEKILYDLEYIEKCNFWLDVKIFFKTILVVFGRQGAR